MNGASRDLCLGARGKNVKLLQSNLKKLGFDISANEINEGFYGSKTEEAVKRFQEKHNLRPTGILDSQSANKMRKLMRRSTSTGNSRQQQHTRYPASRSSPPSSPPEVTKAVSGESIVQGRIQDADAQAFSGGIVRAFNVELRAENLLGETATDSNGCYSIRYVPPEGTEINLRVTTYDTYNKELASSPIYYCAENNKTIDLSLDRDAYHGLSEIERLETELTPLLRGSSLSLAQLSEDEEHDDITFLSGKTGRPALYIALLSLAHKLRQETGLSAEIWYGLLRRGLPAQLHNLLRQSPEIQRRALETAVKDNIIPFRFGEQLDDVLARLKQLMVKKALEPQDQGHQRQTSDPAAKASLGQLLSTVLADRTKQETFLSDYLNNEGEPISEFWSLLRSKPALRDHVEDLEFAFQAATLANNHLPMVQELQRMRHVGEITSIQDLVRFDEKDWLEMISRPRGGDRLPNTNAAVIGFPSDIPGNDDKEKAANYARVLTEMVEDISPTAFITRRLEKVSGNDYHDDYHGGTCIPGKSDVLTFLKDNPEYDFKYGRLESYLERKPGALDNAEDVEGTKSCLKTMQRCYRLAPRYNKMIALMEAGLGSAHTIASMGENTFMAKYGNALGGPISAKAIHGRAMEVQAKAITLLAEHGIASYKVPMAALPDEAQMQIDGIPEWSTLFGSLDLCKCEHCRSVLGPAAYLVDLLSFLKYRPSKVEGKSAKDILFDRRPDLGEIELTCENANTPLPYIDLVIEILEHAVSPFPPFSPFTLVRELEIDLNNKVVSPDLKNSFDPPLYEHALITIGGQGEPWPIDEPWWIIDDLAFTYTIQKKKIDSGLHVVARSLQTKGSASERAATPQYINIWAYEVLKKGVFPWKSLPFDLWGEEARTYLGHIGVMRHQIMETFRQGDRMAILNDSVIAREYFGISTWEAYLITGDIESQTNSMELPKVWNLWGFEAESLSFQHSIPDPLDRTRRITTGDWLEIILTRVDVFLQQSGLSYEELLELLDTVFVNPLFEVGGAGGNNNDGKRKVRTIHILSTDPKDPYTCETAKLQLKGFGNPLRFALKIMRFIRLWRKLGRGWTMRDLDRAITALKPKKPDGTLDEKLDDKFISQLTHVHRLCVNLNLPVVNVLSFWSPIDTESNYVDYSAHGRPKAPSLYAELFRNKTASEILDPTFPEDHRKLRGTLTEHAAAVSIALKITTTDFHILFNSPYIIPRNSLGLPDDRLTLENLSLLYKHSIVAMALKIPIYEYVSLLELVSSRTVGPFASTAGTVLFIENVNRVRASPFSISELVYLLLPPHNDKPSTSTTNTTNTSVAPTEEAIAVILDEIRAGLKRIAAENTLNEVTYGDAKINTVTDPSGTIVRQKLALLNWDSNLIEKVLGTINDGVKYQASLDALPDDLEDLEDLNDMGTYSVDLESLPPLPFSFPPEVSNFIRHDSTNKKLIASLFFLERERELLRKASTDATYMVAIEALFKLQDELHGRISYDQTNGRLEFTGIMSVRRRDKLRDANSDEKYKKAIDSLFDAPKRFVSRYLRNFSLQDFSADLPGLPASVHFPKDIENKVYYDYAEESKQLHFIGVMTEEERDRLLELSSDTNDPNHSDYSDAVNELYNKPDNEDYKVDLESLPPPPFSFPPDIEDFIRFDSDAKKLVASRFFSEEERRQLRGASSDQAYTTAIETLFTLQGGWLLDNATTPDKRFLQLLRRLLPSLQQTLSEILVKQKIAEHLNVEFRIADKLLTHYVNSRVYIVPLVSLPPGFSFPSEVSGHIRHDSTVHKLIASRLFSEGERKLLRNASSDPEYMSAIEALFTIQDNSDLQDHKSLSAFVPTPPDFTAKDFAESAPNVKLTRDRFPIQFNAFTLLHKIANIMARFKISDKQLNWIFEYGQEPGIGWLDLNKLPIIPGEPSASFIEWLRLLILVGLRDGLPLGELILGEIFRLARLEGNPDNLLEEILNRLSENTRWDLTELRYLVNKQVLDFTKDKFRDEQALVHLWDCFSLIKGLKLSARQCHDLAKADVTHEVSRSIRQSVRARYSGSESGEREDQWLSVAKPLRDQLRDNQRTALSDYLVTQLRIPLPNLMWPHPSLSIESTDPALVPAIKELQQKLNAVVAADQVLKIDGIFSLETQKAVIDFQKANNLQDNGKVEEETWSLLDNVSRRSSRDKNDLYAHFLIDVEMSPCMVTSRIRLELSSIQLFVQRCLMDLEKNVDAGAEVDERWSEWNWMKSDRSWVANRMIFLYPENWIEPGLRDDKSPFFMELESELLQGELTDKVAEDALTGYLAKLDEVARLEIVGTYHQIETKDVGDPPSKVVLTDILHVFGRTPSTPHVYYYRQLVKSVYWTPWQRVGLNIESDYLLPVVWNRSLYLFWPTFTEKEDYPGKYDVTISWSEWQENKWSETKVSSSFIEYLQPYCGENTPIPIQNVLVLRSGTSWLRPGTLNILFTEVLLDNCPRTEKAFEFRFKDRNSDPEAVGPYSQSPYLYFVPRNTKVFYNFFKQIETSVGLCLPVSDEDLDLTALSETPSLFRLLPPQNHFPEFLHEGASFYMDDTRTFVVSPFVPDDVDVGWWKPDEIDPALVHDIPKIYHDEIKQSQTIIATALEGDPKAVTGNSNRSMDTIPISTGPNIIQSSDSLLQSVKLIMDSSKKDDSAHLDRIATLMNYPVSQFQTQYHFRTFYHPFVGAFIRELNYNGVDGLLQRDMQITPEKFTPPPVKLLDFESNYKPNGAIVTGPWPLESVHFDYADGYASYNWELFFHIPLLIADRLSKNQRFEEAQKWFHLIFNPTDSSDHPIPRKYWRTKPFFNTTVEGYQNQRIEFLLKLLALGTINYEELTDEEKQIFDDFKNSIELWRQDPFNPHLIARTRSTSYQKTVVMKYIDNLIAWGDHLFRRETMESINEATQLYILAAEILGHRPQEVPGHAGQQVQTYNTLESTLDIFSNALIQVEELISPSGEGNLFLNYGALPAMVTSPTLLYFCVPKNDELLSYWDLVADRLFKVRHCMNIKGIVRQLRLYEEPIDPALLVRATEAGIDIISVINDINPVSANYRFNVLAQKASELCSELKSLGAQLLSALEKKDAEQLTLIRAEHETSLLRLIELVKKRQLEAAEQDRAALYKSRDISKANYTYFGNLLREDPLPPKFDELIRERFHRVTVHLANIPELPPRPPPASDESGAAEAGWENLKHKVELLRTLGEEPYVEGEEQVTESLMNAAQARSDAAGPELAASLFESISSFGGILGLPFRGYAAGKRDEAEKYALEAELYSKLVDRRLRTHEWNLKYNLAAKEIMQIDKQIKAAEIRIEIAKQDLANHVKQIENARQVEDFMRSKYTNQELYSWMIGQVSSVYFQSYQLAYDVAKRAETAFRFELGLEGDSNFIQFGYWDSLKRGLLAGERLYHDIKRMEVAYLDQNQREYEITKHISLSRLDPLALAQLKQTGECFVSVPEALFDLDYPGHYLRRMKFVSMTAPCVTGPYTGVNCTLTLLKSSIRHSTSLLDSPPRYRRHLEEEDTRFVDSSGAVESIVTSRGQDDSGLFETNLNDGRFLPFEGSGVISEWQIRLPRDFRQYDYDTISDVILHIRYTAREGGEPLRNQAVAELKDALNEFLRTEGQNGLALPISLRHEFPSEWHRFMNPPKDSTDNPTLPQNKMPINLGLERFPFMVQGRPIVINNIEMFLKVSPDYTDTHNETTLKLTLTNPSSHELELKLNPWNGLLRAVKEPNGNLEGELGIWILTGQLDGPPPGSIDPNAIEDILVVCNYSL